MHSAAAALAGVASDVGAGQAQFLAQELREEHARLNGAFMALAIDGQADG
jgi:hypothetical protein